MDALPGQGKTTASQTLRDRAPFGQAAVPVRAPLPDARTSALDACHDQMTPRRPFGGVMSPSRLVARFYRAAHPAGLFWIRAPAYLHASKLLLGLPREVDAEAMEPAVT